MICDDRYCKLRRNSRRVEPNFIKLPKKSREGRGIPTQQMKDLGLGWVVKPVGCCVFMGKMTMLEDDGMDGGIDGGMDDGMDNAVFRPWSTSCFSLSSA